MLKKIYTRKIMIATLALFALFLLYLMPNNKKLDYKIKNTSLEYEYSNQKEVIYLLDTNGYVARTTIKSENLDTKATALDVAKGLIIDGEKSHIIPNGFRAIIPAGTEILGLNLENKILTINFSKDLLNIDEKEEEKMIEAIIYSLTSIEGIDKVTIQVEGKTLENLPHSKKNITFPQDKKYGINKKYDLTTTSSIESYTIYYVCQQNDNQYYVPVTKYINNKGEDKIKIIVDELSTSPIYETNLMSYLDTNVVLKDYSLEENQLKLNFNEAILSDKNKHILEEVVYTLGLSMEENYNVKTVMLFVNNKEVYKIENLDS